MCHIGQKEVSLVSLTPMQPAHNDRIISSEIITYWWGEGTQQALVLETETSYYVYPNVKMEVSKVAVTPNVVEGEERWLYGGNVREKDNNTISHLNLYSEVFWTAYPAPATCIRNLIMSHTDIKHNVSEGSTSESLCLWIKK